MPKNNFCQRCPRGLKSPPSELCPLGLEHVAAAQDGVRRRRDVEDAGCPWGVASAEHGYCFWSWLRARSDGEGRMDPVPDKEICMLLGITQSALERTLASALAKAKAGKDEPEWQAFREAVIDRAAQMPDDNTVYLPDNFKVPLPTQDDEEAAEDLPAELLVPDKRKRMNSMPLHRSGKRTDLYGLYSRKRKERKDD